MDGICYWFTFKTYTRSGVRTHADICPLELKSNALTTRPSWCMWNRLLNVGVDIDYIFTLRQLHMLFKWMIRNSLNGKEKVMWDLEDAKKNVHDGIRTRFPQIYGQSLYRLGHIWSYVTWLHSLESELHKDSLLKPYQKWGSNPRGHMSIGT